MMALVAQVVVRAQRAKRGASGFSGPDTYVAVAVYESGQVVPALRADAPFPWKRVGEGYHKIRGARSMLGKALDRAHALVQRANTRLEQGADPATVLGD